MRERLQQEGVVDAIIRKIYIELIFESLALSKSALYPNMDSFYPLYSALAV